VSAEEIFKGFTNPSTILGFKFHLLTRIEELYIYMNLNQCTTAVQRSAVHTGHKYARI
jgi:hypothetical protein